ncbi:N-acetylmuramoyl-L-alanine amidase [Cytobacillus firmus]|uniref:N-acetylmuramoyl-L-alanine amidase n=1 Tax=Cytobacillus firmus TaxID=1399 RepID=UPI00384D2EE0
MRKFVLGILVFLLMFPISEIESEAAGSFKDISTNHRAYNEINYLAQGNIVSGTLDGYFRPGKVVTRGEAAAMMGRALNLNGRKRATQFSDVGSQYFASGYIQSAVEAGILTGYKDGSFKPGQIVDRGEMAVIISKAFGYEFGGTLSGAARALISRGISQGTADGSFGADQKIIRADYAIFLARAVNYKLRLTPGISYPADRSVTEDSVPLRTGPSNLYSSLGTLQTGNKVEASYAVGPWVYIRLGSKEGFIHSNYLNAPFGMGNQKILNQQMIVIDPGHGGKDPGAVGYGLKEKDVVLSTSLKLKSYLSRTPFQYKLTRETDKFIELSDRVAFAKQANANVFISVHANAYNGSANGTETYYYASNNSSADSKILASKIQGRLVTAWKLYDRGIKHGNFHVLRENTMPAVLVELGFIDNKTDNAKLASDAWRREAAKAIYWGILDYYKEKGFYVTHLYNK